jgi:mannose-1-phosphate guanylyltransferase/mannose-6-phosphate isomerase
MIDSMKSVYPVILSGGSGTRLWPKSRQFYPKQLHKLYGNCTLLQHTINRVDFAERFIVICNNEQRFMVADQVSQIAKNEASYDIILEPTGRNTAPAIIVAALHAQSIDKDAIIAVFAADHLIRNVQQFRVALEEAVKFAREDKLVAFGVTPTKPETGYGYIRSNEKNGVSCPIAEFVEKPNLEAAERYLASGDYYWNSGMFVFKASIVLQELVNLRPEMVDNCRLALDQSVTDLDFIRLAAEPFAKCTDISIDYALMEKTKRAWIVPLKDSGWSDIGSWDALWEVSDKDKSGNVFVGDVIADKCTNCYVNSEGRLVSLVGLDDIVVVDTADAVMVMKKSEAQNVKNIVNILKQKGRSEFTLHREVHRPWGSFDVVDIGDRYQVRRITVKPGASLSLQKHDHRSEHWVVVSGEAEIQRGGELFHLTENQSAYIPAGEKHLLHNPGQISLRVIEVKSGEYIGEDDVTRY